MGKQTQTIRLIEPDGTYEVTLVEKSRRRVTTEDDLVDVIARMVADAQQAYQNEHTLRYLGRKDVYRIFAQEFVRNLRIQTDVNDLVRKYLADSTDPSNATPTNPNLLNNKEQE